MMLILGKRKRVHNGEYTEEECECCDCDNVHMRQVEVYETVDCTKEEMEEQWKEIQDYVSSMHRLLLEKTK